MINRHYACAVERRWTTAGESEGLAAVSTGTGKAYNSVADACEIGFIDKEGEFVIPPRFLAAGSFHDHFCLVENEKEIAYVDRGGESIWKSGWVELGSLDPLHLYPPDSATSRRLA